MSARTEAAARIYVEAIEAGVPPVPEVARQLGVVIRTATHHITNARREGILTATADDIRNPKALAVARELGVDYEELVAAIHKHAHGDLRISRAPHLGKEEA